MKARLIEREREIEHLGYFIALDSWPFPIWRFTWGLCSVIEGLFLSHCLWHFWRGFRSGHKIFPIFPAQYGSIIFFRLIYQSFRRSPLLSPGFSFTPLLPGWFLRALPCPKRFPVFSGIRDYWRYCSAPANNFLGSRIHAFLYRCSVTKKVYWDILPGFLRAYFGGRLSSSFCRVVDN